MPVHSVVDLSNRVVLTVLSGVVTFREATAQVTKLRADPAFDPGFSELIDLSAVSEIQMSYAVLKSLMEIDPFSTTSKRALVNPSPKSISGAALLYRIMQSDEVCVQVFASTAEALRWLTFTT
ncbi:MAG: hypothetical protein WB919_04210 [Candidatus Sulfotelmatobacter sp.]